MYICLQVYEKKTDILILKLTIIGKLWRRFEGAGVGEGDLRERRKKVSGQLSGFWPLREGGVQRNPLRFGDGGFFSETLFNCLIKLKNILIVTNLPKTSETIFCHHGYYFVIET